MSASPSTFDSMSTRRERRAQARGKIAARNVPLSQPSRDTPSHKTLLDLANERQLLDRSSQANSSITTTKINPDGSLSASNPVDSSSDPVETPYLDIALYTITLSLLHFT